MPRLSRSAGNGYSHTLLRRILAFRCAGFFSYRLAIYLGDRFADTMKLPAASPVSLRHHFCREHLIGWWVAVVVIFFLDVALALRSLDLQMLLLGGTLGVVCALYLFINHSLGGRSLRFR